MEHRQVDVRSTAGRGTPADEAARFFRELRQLRDGAGLGPAELAARAHYPYDFIKAAEAGPALPDLPVLTAYVRGCGGTTEEWEERWRSLTRSPAVPLQASRSGGESVAASAGARIGSISPVADVQDPSIVLAALDRVAEGMAVGTRAAATGSKGTLGAASAPPGADVVPRDVPRQARPVSPAAGADKTGQVRMATTAVTSSKAAPTVPATPVSSAAPSAPAAKAETPAADSEAVQRTAPSTPARSTPAPAMVLPQAGQPSAPLTGSPIPAQSLSPAPSLSPVPSRLILAAIIAVALCVIVALLAILL